jgi:predicted phosphodiesterase
MKHTLSVLLLFIVFCSFGQEQFKITHGPYLQHLDQSGVTIVWTTNKEAVSWVELAPVDNSNFYLKERPKYFSAENGFKEISRVHSIRINNLSPATKYRYRIFSREVLKREGTKLQYGNVAATKIFKEKLLEFTTPDQKKQNLSFLMVNDIHGNKDLLDTLLNKGDFQKTDLVLFNGDMASAFTSEEQIFGDFMDTAVRLFAKEEPMYYCRGNHETRGNFAGEFSRYFPSPSGKLYYLLREGPVCFIMLDCGEDKPDSDIEYSGIAAFDQYRDTEVNWLKEVLKSKDFTGSAIRIAVVHMPPFGGWHGNDEIARKFVPVLNEAGVDVMLCGHLHRYVRQDPGAGINFPVIVNSNRTVLKGTFTDGIFKMNILNEKGERIDSLKIIK